MAITPFVERDAEAGACTRVDGLVVPASVHALHVGIGGRPPYLPIPDVLPWASEILATGLRHLGWDLAAPSVTVVVESLFHPFNRVQRLRWQRGDLWRSLVERGLLLPSGPLTETGQERDDGALHGSGRLVTTMAELSVAVEVVRDTVGLCLLSPQAALPGRLGCPLLPPYSSASTIGREDLLNVVLPALPDGVLAVHPFGAFDDAEVGLTVHLLGRASQELAQVLIDECRRW